MIFGILHICETGSQWRNLPGQYGPYSTIYKHFNKWSRDKIFDQLNEKIIEDYKKEKIENNSWGVLMIDATYIKSIYGEDNVGKNPTDRGRNATKLSAIVDENQICIATELVPGNVHDSTILNQTIKNAKLGNHKVIKLLADKGYASARCKREARNHKLNLVAPNKKKTKKIFKKDPELKKRNKVEGYFSYFKKKKKCSLRYDRLNICFRATVNLAITIINFKKIVSLSKLTK